LQCYGWDIFVKNPQPQILSNWIQFQSPRMDLIVTCPDRALNCPSNDISIIILDVGTVYLKLNKKLRVSKICRYGWDISVKIFFF
jgi:hypothetical protein